MNRAGRFRAAGFGLILGGIAAIAWFTLRPGPTPDSSPNGCCSPVDILQNILLYLPAGAGFALLGLRARAVAAIGLLFSGAIEASQMQWIAGRFAALPDVAANVVGSLLGVLLVTRWSARARWWRFLAPVLAVGTLLWWLGVAFKVRPIVPGPYLWNIQWANRPDRTGPFTSRVLAVTFQDRPLAEGSLSEREVERFDLSRSDTIRLDAAVVSGSVHPGRVSLVSIAFGARGREYLSLWQEGSSLLAYQRLNFTIADQRGVWVRLDDALPPAAGDTVRIVLTTTRNRVQLAAAAGAVTRRTSLPLSPELYLGALLLVRNQSIDGIEWWAVLPAVVSLLALGLALANHPAILFAGTAACLLLGPLLMGSSPAWWPILGAAVLAAWAGRRLALRLDLFGAR